MPDPKLKAAMEEIKPILAKYDIAAICLLASNSHMEFYRALTPTWACTSMSPEGFFRIKWKRAEFPDQESYRRAAENTIGMLAGFMDAARNESDQMANILRMIGGKVKFSHYTREEPPNG